MKSDELTGWLRCLAVSRRLWMVTLIIAVQADAAELHVQALSLPYASPWQRAAPEQEVEDDALLLDAAEAGLQLALMRQVRNLQTQTETYFARLTKSCQARHGDNAQTFWHEAGTRNWLVCRGQLREGSVFHLSTVFAERAYSLVLFAPAKADQLPGLVLDLLANVRFESSPALQRPDTKPDAPVWMHTRTLFPQAGADVLAELVRSDLSRLGDDGMLTGYGLAFDIAGMTWFIEGYQWKADASQVRKVAWKQDGRLEFDLASALDATVNGQLRLTLAEDAARVSAGLSVWQLCGPAAHIADVLEQLQSGERMSLSKLDLAHFAGCPEADVADASGALPVLRGESGNTVQIAFTASMPPLLDARQLESLRQAGMSRIGLVEIALHADDARHAGFGDRLVEHARAYVVYEQKAR